MEKRYFEGVQDSKEFQGELFGISNLFCDLSDKLFTSEIIELHEQQQDQDRKQHSILEPVSGTTFSRYREDNESDMSETNSGKQDSLNGSHVPLPDEDMGIVYAHRNEDIVNSKPDVQAGKVTSSNQCNISFPASKRKANEVTGKENIDSLKDWKKKEFKLVARHMGMGELEFSKWLLAAKPAQREEVLQDYNKSKEKNQGN